jgi:hypothetical protein
MHRNLLIRLAVVALCCSDATAHAADSIAVAVPATPATRSVAATTDHSPLTTHHSLALYQYFYIDFPRQLQLLQNEKQLAEAELDLIARRVESYRPFRSFGRYAATYTVDQSWQIALLAAQQRLECLRNDEADLWRQRQAVAIAYQGKSSGL